MAVTSTPSPAELRRIACDAAATCAPELAGAFRSTPAELQVATKRNTHDLVTLHDRATEDALVAFLEQAVPGSRFTGEEGGSRKLQAHDRLLSEKDRRPCGVIGNAEPEASVSR